MVKLESLKKSNHFRLALREKRIHTDYFSIFASKNFLKTKKDNLIIEEEKEQLQEKIEEEKIEQEKNIEEKKNEYTEETIEKNIKKNNNIFMNENSLEDEKYYLIN